MPFPLITTTRLYYFIRANSCAIYFQTRIENHNEMTVINPNVISWRTAF